LPDSALYPMKTSRFLSSPCVARVVSSFIGVMVRHVRFEARH
jgi:hypothetical protein